MDPIGEAILWQGLDVAAPVRAFHDAARGDYDGRVTVTRGAGLAGWLASAMGFPPSMQDRPMRLSVREVHGVSIWRRDFDGYDLPSILRRAGGTLYERFGPMRLAMTVRANNGQLHVDLTGGSLWGLPLPRAVLPLSQSVEFDDGGRLGFDISASLPGLGLLIRYRGWLRPADPDCRA